MNWDAIMPNGFGGLCIETILFLLSLFLLQRIIVRAILRRKKIDITRRRRWVVSTRNFIVFFTLAGLAAIWFTQLRMFAAAAAVFAVAMVIAFKETLVNFIGFFHISGAHFFSIGDRIEMEGLRGDVIDQNLTTTTLLEIGPGTRSHQYTGRTLFIPNGKFITTPVSNETYLWNYLFHIIVIPLEVEDDWLAAEQALLDAAKTVCDPHLDEARKYMKELESTHSLDAPGVDPVVHLQVPEPGRIDLHLRVPLPARRKGRLEQAILRQYFLNLNKNSTNGKIPSPSCGA